MSFIPQRRTELEFLDLPLESYGFKELEGSLADLTIVNRYLGNNRAVLKHLSKLMSDSERDLFTVLDIGTGSADIPLALAGWARKAGKRVEITGIDNNPCTIEIARNRIGACPDIKLAVADCFDLPYPGKSFDFVICSKTLHHFTNQQAVRLIKEAVRVARHGYLILDLRRSWVAYILIYILTRFFTRNRLTRNDGPLSVLKAFTRDELAALAAEAGASGFTIAREPFWLMVLKGGSR
ncbi:MAG TPA: methyltransferase domain-containing protein [Desulfuromonadaceae bacterium]|jgi:ubiquinone/menaquinone biosynthesis C-methylase UbiE